MIPRVPHRAAAVMTFLLWVLAVTLILVGLVGTVLPMLPGTVLIFVGIAVGAWADDFVRVSPWIVGITGLLALISILADYLAAVLGARRQGASREALIGAAIGTVLGVFSGFWGLLFMPLLGAAIGEFIVLWDLRRAGQVGVATWVGLMVGMAVKIAIAFAMIGLFIAALFF
jgi:uncharacterized protein